MPSLGGGKQSISLIWNTHMHIWGPQLYPLKCLNVSHKWHINEFSQLRHTSKLRFPLYSLCLSTLLQTCLQWPLCWPHSSMPRSPFPSLDIVKDQKQLSGPLPCIPPCQHPQDQFRSALPVPPSWCWWTWSTLVERRKITTLALATSRWEKPTLESWALTAHHSWGFCLQTAPGGSVPPPAAERCSAGSRWARAASGHRSGGSGSPWRAGTAGSTPHGTPARERHALTEPPVCPWQCHSSQQQLRPVLFQGTPLWWQIFQWWMEAHQHLNSKPMAPQPGEPHEWSVSFQKCQGV